MNKSGLKEALAKKQPHLSRKNIDRAVDHMIEIMCRALITKDRIEVRGFGSFSMLYRAPRIARNPGSGDPLSLPTRYFILFKPGKELQQRVNESRLICQISKDP